MWRRHERDPFCTREPSLFPVLQRLHRWGRGQGEGGFCFCRRKCESIRAFPLSNWTELDIWLYIYLENIEIVPLYFAAKRPVIERSGTLLMVDDDRIPLKPGETPREEMVRFRTLGCYPLTGALKSTASTLPEIIQEMLLTKFSERQGRLIDFDEEGSMETKKREGYF